MAAVEPNLTIEPVLSPAEVFELRNAIDQIYIDDKIKRYIVDIVHATRRPAEFGLDIAPYVQYGASPRATIFLTRASKAMAFLDSFPFSLSFLAMASWMPVLMTSSVNDISPSSPRSVPASA